MEYLRTPVSITVTIFLVLVCAAAALADPCLVVYPSGPCVYHYDPGEYYTVDATQPRYQAYYDRGGLVLLSTASNSIDASIYQAPGLAGFVADSSDQGYYFEGGSFDLVIDGFSNSPTTFPNILVVVDKVSPSGCLPDLFFDGVQLSGTIYHAGSLVVQTPTPAGHNYSDTVTHHVAWTGCLGVHVWAFSDADFDGRRDGNECFSAYSHDLAVPVENSTFGCVKSLYR